MDSVESLNEKHYQPFEEIIIFHPLVFFAPAQLSWPLVYTPPPLHGKISYPFSLH